MTGVALRAPWWLRPLAMIALARAGYILRDHHLRSWAALVDSIAVALLLEPPIARATRWARRRNRG